MSNEPTGGASGAGLRYSIWYYRSVLFRDVREFLLGLLLPLVGAATLWLGGDDEVALNHRAALRPALGAAGLRHSPAGGRRPGRSSGRPLIGIACTASDLNRCDRD